MPKPSRIELLASVVLAIALFGLGGCATTDAGVNEAAFEQNIQYEVAPSAEITNIAYCIKPYKGCRPPAHVHCGEEQGDRKQNGSGSIFFFLTGRRQVGCTPARLRETSPEYRPARSTPANFRCSTTNCPSGYTILIKELG